MGNYVYTMRKKRVRITDLHGDVQDAVLFSYAYKPGYSFSWNDSHKAMTSRLDRCAERAWDSFNNELVIVGDSVGGIDTLDGAFVYKDVTGAFWTDCNDFPGTAVGLVKAEGRRLRIVRESDWWTPVWPNDRDFRRVVKGGKIVEEMRYHDRVVQSNWEEAQSWGLRPLAENQYRVGPGPGPDGIEIWRTCCGWSVAHIKNNMRRDEVQCWELRQACALAVDTEYQKGGDCPYCDGSMSWCGVCYCWTSNCCIDYGTCQCS